jgi:hypothetical protein
VSIGGLSLLVIEVKLSYVDSFLGMPPEQKIVRRRAAVTSTFPFDGGTIVKVVIEVGDDAYLDLESHMAAAMARD